MIFKHRLALCMAGLLALVLSTTAFAQEPARLALAEFPGVGRVLVDEGGNALYVFLNDERGVSNCSAECLENWPPLLTEGRPITSPGLIPGFVGTLERDEGMQATYMGMPLYYYVGDTEPGMAAGQGLGEVWYLLSSTGETVTGAVGEPDDSAVQEAEEFELDPERMLAGQQAYGTYCAACHGIDGSGGTGGPSLRNRDILADKSYVTNQILHGGSEMPPFQNVLDDEQIAVIATYIRNSFGNSFGPVFPEDVER